MPTLKLKIDATLVNFLVVRAPLAVCIFRRLFQVEIDPVQGRGRIVGNFRAQH